MYVIFRHWRCIHRVSSYRLSFSVTMFDSYEDANLSLARRMLFSLPIDQYQDQSIDVYAFGRSSLPPPFRSGDRTLRHVP